MGIGGSMVLRIFVFLGVEVYFEGDFPMSSLRCK